MYQDICIVNMLGYGVIGNTAVFGTVVLGSSPGSPAFSNMFSLHFDLYILPLSTPLGSLRGFFVSRIVFRRDAVKGERRFAVLNRGDIKVDRSVKDLV